MVMMVMMMMFRKIITIIIITCCIVLHVMKTYYNIYVTNNEPTLSNFIFSTLH